MTNVKLFLALLVSAVLLCCQQTATGPSGPQPLNARRYLPSPNIPHASQPSVVSGNFGLSVSNPFPNDGPIVFLGTTAPTGMALATPYYSTGNGTTGLNAYRLADSVNMMMAADSDVGNVTIYEVDWTFITLGAVAPASDGTISVASHGLSVGDTVYIAASAGSVSLKSGAYVVHTVPSAGTFTVYGLSVSPGDTLNYLAKVNETAGAIPF